MKLLTYAHPAVLVLPLSYASGTTLAPPARAGVVSGAVSTDEVPGGVNHQSLINIGNRNDGSDSFIIKACACILMVIMDE